MGLLNPFKRYQGVDSDSRDLITRTNRLIRGHPPFYASLSDFLMRRLDLPEGMHYSTYPSYEIAMEKLDVAERNYK